jgi:hypothetical protein
MSAASRPREIKDAAEPWSIMPRVESEPTIAEKGVEPGVEIRRRGVGRDADVAKIAVCIASPEY